MKKKIDTFKIFYAIIIFSVVILAIKFIDLPDFKNYYPTFNDVIGIKFLESGNTYGLKFDQITDLDKEDVNYILTVFQNMDVSNDRYPRGQLWLFHLVFAIVEERAYHIKMFISEKYITASTYVVLNNRRNEEYEKWLYTCVIDENYRDGILSVLKKYEGNI